MKFDRHRDFNQQIRVYVNQSWRCGVVDTFIGAEPDKLMVWRHLPNPNDFDNPIGVIAKAVYNSYPNSCDSLEPHNHRYVSRLEPHTLKEEADSLIGIGDDIIDTLYYRIVYVDGYDTGIVVSQMPEEIKRRVKAAQ